MTSVCITIRNRNVLTTAHIKRAILKSCVLSITPTLIIISVSLVIGFFSNCLGTILLPKGN